MYRMNSCRHVLKWYISPVMRYRSPMLLAYAILMATIYASRLVAGEYSVALKILGGDLVTPEEITSVLPLEYTDAQLTQAHYSLPPAKILNELAERHYVLIFGPPTRLSLLDIRELRPASFFQNPDLDGVWYERLEAETFSREDTVDPQWFAIMKEPVRDSRNKNWKEQLATLSKRERPANVAEFSWLVIMYQSLRGMGLFQGKPFVRTSGVDSRGSHVYAFQMRRNDGARLAFSGYWDNRATPAIGLSAMFELDRP